MQGTGSGHESCGCNLETGHVCDACEKTADKVITEMSDYVNNFLDKRFPEGINGDMRQILGEIVMDAFHDGARWQEKQVQEESRIITL